MIIRVTAIHGMLRHAIAFQSPQGSPILYIVDLSDHIGVVGTGELIVQWSNGVLKIISSGTSRER